MIKPRAAFLAAACIALSLPGCNIYQSATGIDADSPDEHIFEGQVLLRKAKYDEALTHFETAIRKDSSKSEAYFGAAKASLLGQRINMFKLVQSFSNNDGKSIPFLSEPDTVKDKIYVANRGITRYLGILIRKDTSGKADGKIRTGRFSADYALSTAIEAVLSLADFNSDGRINAGDNILAGIIDFTDPSKMNPDSIMANLADLKNDPEKTKALNTLLDKTEELLAKSDQAIDLFLNTALGGKDSVGALCPEGTDSAKCEELRQASGGVSGEKIDDNAMSQVKQFIQDAGSTVVIYKVFDREDNDGDGCADEEVLDGIDNDGDNRIDEDSRGAPEPGANPRFHADKDSTNNNMTGGVDEPAEAAFHERYLAGTFPFNPLADMDRNGQIFWVGTPPVDTRDTVFITIDSTATPPVTDTVITFDLCKGPVTGFKKGK